MTDETTKDIFSKYKKIYDIFTGILAEDPELKYFDSGKVKCTFSIPLKDYNNKETKAAWLNCECWSKKAEMMATNFFKGDEITVFGYFQEREYQGKRYVTFNVKGIM